MNKIAYKIFIIIISAATISGAHSKAYAEKKTIYVKPLAIIQGLPKTDTIGKQIKDFISEFILSKGGYSVTTDNEVEQVIKQESLKMTLQECTDDECIKMLMNSIKTDYIIFGTVAFINSKYRITIKLLGRTSGKALPARVKTVEFSNQKKLKIISMGLAAYLIGDKSLNIDEILTLQVDLKSTRGKHTDKIKIEWGKSAEAEKYSIYRALKKSGDFNEIGSTPETYYEDKNAIPGKEYWYKITAWSKKSGHSNDSKAESGYRRLSKPIIKSSDGILKNTITVSWEEVEGAEKYFIYRNDSKTGKYKLIDNVKGNIYKDTSITQGRKYWYRIKAWAPTGFSDDSIADSGFAFIPLAPYYLRGIVPGWGQFYAEKRTKGYIFMSGFIAAGAVTGYFFFSMISKQDEYNSLGAGASKDEFDSKHKDAKDAGKLYDYSLSVFALVYIANWVDIVFFTKPGQAKQLGTLQKRKVFISMKTFRTSDLLHERRTNLSFGMRF